MNNNPTTSFELQSNYTASHDDYVQFFKSAPPKSKALPSPDNKSHQDWLPSILRYAGGKTKLRPKIIPKILAHWDGEPDREYREAFAGNASIGLGVLSDPRVRRAWLNDYDPGIAALWVAVQQHPGALCKLIQSCKPNDKEFDRLKDFFLNTPVNVLRFMDPVELGAAKLLLHRITPNGRGPKSGGPQGGRNGGDKILSRWKPDDYCRLVPKLHHLLTSKEVRITSLDFQAVLTAPGKCAFYLDPPYLKQGPALYQHAFSQQDHLRLHDVLRRCGQPWVLSYDDEPFIRQLYEFADITSPKAKELIITSIPGES